MTASVWTMNGKTLLAEFPLEYLDGAIRGEGELLATGTAIYATCNGHRIDFRPIFCQAGEYFSMEMLDVLGMDDLYPEADHA